MDGIFQFNKNLRDVIKYLGLKDSTSSFKNKVFSLDSWQVK